MSTQCTAQQYPETCRWVCFDLGLAKSLFLQNESQRFHYLQEACKTVNALKNVKNHAGRCPCHYTETAFQSRQRVDIYPGNMGAVVASARIYTKQPSSHCLGIGREREKHVRADLFASGLAWFAFCNANPAVNRTRFSIYHLSNSYISSIDEEKFSQGSRSCRVLPQKEEKFSLHICSLTNT